MSELRIEPDEARQIEGAVFIDARNPHDWGEADTKIPGAIRIPANGFAEHEAELEKGRTYITYCT